MLLNMYIISSCTVNVTMTDKKTLQIVVARYKENPEWLKPLSQHCIIYNKGPDNVVGFDNVVKLTNFGRESDTYLKHILDHYPNFCDYTMFTQGQVRDHVRSVPALIKSLEQLINGEKDQLPGYVGLNEVRVRQGWGVINNWHDRSHPGLPLKAVWDLLYDTMPKDESLEVNYCAIFMVSKEHLLFHSKKFYQIMADYQATHEPAAGYVCERLFTTIMRAEIKGRAEIEDAIESPIARKCDALFPSSSSSTDNKKDNALKVEADPIITLSPSREPEKPYTLTTVYNGRYTRVVRDYSCPQDS